MDKVSKTNKNTSVKLFFLTCLMFGFGFSLIPFYNAICEVTGINILAARDKAEMTPEELENNQVDYTRKVAIEFDSNSHGPWDFKAAERSIMVHPGELVMVEFEVTNPSTINTSGQAIPSYAPLQAASYLKKLDCFCFEQQNLNAGETKLFPVVFVIDKDIPKSITSITMSYTFFELLSQNHEETNYAFDVIAKLEKNL